MITICPKVVKYVPVSTTTRPVTQTADVAVKRASTNESDSTPALAAGNINNTAPIKIKAKKVSATNLYVVRCCNNLIINTKIASLGKSLTHRVFYTLKQG